MRENSQGRDPSTQERISQGPWKKAAKVGNVSTRQIHSQKNLNGGEFRKKWKEKKWKGRRRQRKKVKHRRNLLRTKRKAQSARLIVSERKEEEVKEKGKKRNKSPRAEQLLGRSGRWLFLLLILMQNWF